MSQHYLRVGPGEAELLHQRRNTTDDKVVTQVHDEVTITREVPGHQHGMGQSERGFLTDVRDPEAKSGPVSYGRLDRVGSVTDEQADIGDATSLMASRP
jgi:hypothetical protein